MPKRFNSKPKRKTNLNILRRNKSNISEKEQNSLEKAENLKENVDVNEPIDKISIEINNIPEIDYDLNTMQTRRKKYKRIGLTLNREELEDLNTIINKESKENNDFIRHKRKRTWKKLEKKNSSKSLDLSDEKELKDFINKKTCLNQSLLKYKNLYKKKKNNKIIVLKEEDEEKYFKNINNENNNINNENKNINNIQIKKSNSFKSKKSEDSIKNKFNDINENKKKPLKVLKKIPIIKKCNYHWMQNVIYAVLQ